MNIDPSKSKLVAEHKHDAPLLSCAFDSAGRFLFAGGRDRGLVCLDLKNESQKKILAGHESWVNQIARAADARVLTADYVGRVIAWDCGADEPKIAWNIEAHPSTIYGLAVSADGKSFATGDRDGAVRVWRADSGERLHELPRLDQPVYGVAMHPDGQRLVTCDRRPQKPRLRIWEIASGKELNSIEVAELSGYRNVEDFEWGGIRALTISPDGKQLIALGRTGYDGQAAALIYGTEDGKLQHKLAVALKGGFYYGAKFHPQGFLLSAGGDIGKGELRAWDIQAGKSLAELATSGPCTACDIHPDGNQFAATLATGKGSYPDAGSVSIYRWET